MPEAKKLRKYEVIWEEIKNAEVDKWVNVDVKDIAMIQTIINMVQVEKSAQNVNRKRLDLPAFGKLEIRRDLDKKRVSFRLRGSGAGL
jgi:hypothetical protein